VSVGKVNGGRVVVSGTRVNGAVEIVEDGGGNGAPVVRGIEIVGLVELVEVVAELHAPDNQRKRTTSRSPQRFTIPSSPEAGA
jgi:hypothetical protein